MSFVEIIINRAKERTNERLKAKQKYIKRIINRNKLYEKRGK